MKKCIHCEEYIQDEAIKCRYCGEFFDKQKENGNISNAAEKESNVSFDNLGYQVKDGNSTKNKWTISGIVGGLIGLALGRYTGINLLIPLAGAFLCGWLASKFIKQASRPMIAAFAVQGGQIFWFSIGCILTKQFASSMEAILVIAGLIWLIINPGLVVVICLTIYQIVGLVVNLSAFLALPFGDSMHKALSVHIVFRVLGIILMFYGLYEIRKKNTTIKRG